MRTRVSWWVTCVSLALVLVAVLAAAASAIPDGSTVLIDRPSGFGALPFDGVTSALTTPYSMSASGRFVVFTSNNSDLLDSDDDGFFNVYRIDLQAPRQVELVSRTASGTPGDGNSNFASISADGRYVAFTSNAQNLHPDLPVLGGALVKDMQTGAIELASHGDDAADHGPTRGTFEAVISGDGRTVGFLGVGGLSGANADAPDGPGVNAFVRHLDGPAHTYLLSDKGGTAAGATFVPVVPSFDGSAAAFASMANFENAMEAQPDPDAYRVTGIGSTMSLELASTTAGSQAGSQTVTGGGVALSSDGKHVAWANNHVWEKDCSTNCGGPTNNQEDFLVSGSPSNQFIRDLAFPRQPNGTSAPTREYWTTDGKLKSEDTNGTFDVYTHRPAVAGEPGLDILTTGTFPGGAETGAARDDAAVTVFSSASSALPGTDGWQTQVFVRIAGQTALISQQEGADRRAEAGNGIISPLHAVSADGRRVLFSTLASAFGVPVVGRFPATQSFVRDVVTGETIPVTRAADGSPADQPATSVTIDGGGDRVVFASSATNLAADVVPDGHDHVYLRDLGSGSLTLLDRGPDGKPEVAEGDVAAISGDGQHVVFRSGAHDLDGNDPLSNAHIFELDLTTGKFTMADRTSNGTIANRSALFSDVSDDGRFVAFTSQATNLGGGTDPAKSHVYVKDLVTGAVTWASVPEDGKTDHGNASGAVSLSGDGSHVAFVPFDPNFGYGGQGALNVYVRDLAGGTTMLASSIPDISGASGPSLNRTGSRVLFTAFGVGANSSRLWIRDIPGGAPVQLPTGRLGASTGSLSAQGTCVAFSSRSNDLVSGGYASPSYFHAYLHGMGSDCPAAGGGNAAPVASRFRITNNPFAVGRRSTRAVAGGTGADAARRRKVPRGTKFKFRLSEDATTTITIQRMLPGRRKGKRCVKPRRGLRKRCTRFVKATRLVRRNTKQGNNTVAYTGRIRKKALKPGRYRATLTATDSGGLKSKPRRLKFRVVRARR